MSKKNVILSVVLLALLVFAAYEFWPQRETVQVYTTVRQNPARNPARGRGWFGRGGSGGGSNPAAEMPYTVVFGFDRKLKPDTIKVVVPAMLETNKFARPQWDLVGETNTVAIKSLIYGITPRGMRPRVKNALPDPLFSGVKYRLLMEAGGVKVSQEFSF